MKDDQLSFPAGFCDIGEISFKKLYEIKKEFVDFTLKDMEKPKGLFLKWKTYCQNKINEH